MPPSGYNQPVIDDFTHAPEGCYKMLRQEVATGKHADFGAGVQWEIDSLTKALTKAQFEGKNALRGNLVYILGCYQDVAFLVESGQCSTYEAAATLQLQNLRRDLTRLDVDQDGNVVDK